MNEKEKNENESEIKSLDESSHPYHLLLRETGKVTSINSTLLLSVTDEDVSALLPLSAPVPSISISVYI